MITQARHTGSVPPEMGRALRRASERRQLRCHEDEVDRIETPPPGLEVVLSSGTVLQPDRVLLATGFASSRPGGSMIEELITSASLPCAPCGYPIVDPSLRWHPRIHVSGPLAELELGPVARNIAGARRAADRIVESINATTATAN